MVAVTLVFSKRRTRREQRAQKKKEKKEGIPRLPTRLMVSDESSFLESPIKL